MRLILDAWQYFKAEPDCIVIQVSYTYCILWKHYPLWPTKSLWCFKCYILWHLWPSLSRCTLINPTLLAYFYDIYYWYAIPQNWQGNISCSQAGFSGRQQRWSTGMMYNDGWESLNGCWLMWFNGWYSGVLIITHAPLKHSHCSVINCQ